MSVEGNGYPNGENGEVSARHDSTAEHSFDDVARGVATGTVPRRKALRILAASLFGGAFAAAPAVAVAAPKPGGTGCSISGQVRDDRGKCVCPSGTEVCGNRCVNSCPGGTGQTLNNNCQCTCGNNQVLCGGNCVTDNCPSGQFLNTAGGACTCECLDTN